MKTISIFTLVFSLFFLNACKEKIDPSNELPEGYSKSNIEQVLDLVLGNSSNNDDELVGGMVVDNSNNIYLSMNITDASVNRSIIFAKVSASGQLMWARLLDSGKEELSPDSGENAETGGTAGSIDIDNDGNIYVVGKGGASSSNFNSLIVVKLNGSDGSLIAAKKWRKNFNEIASSETVGYAIDVEGDYVYVVGFSAENKLPVLCLNRKTMDILFQYELDITVGTVTRGYAVKADGSGNLYVAGLDGSKTFVAKISNANSSAPTLVYSKYISLPYASRINNLDLDNTGVYYSADIRGANTDFVAFKTDFDAQFLWGVSYKDDENDRNNTHTVKVSGNYLYVGGRIGLKDLDIKQGDGIVLCVDKSNGDFKWAKVLFSGKEEGICEHRVKSISILSNGNIVALGQVYGGNDNTDHFYADWVENNDLSTTQYNVNFTQANATFTQITATNAGLQDIENFASNNYAITLQNSKDKKANNPPDCDAFINVFKVK